MKELFARPGQNLKNHLENTASLAAGFCADFQSSGWGYLLGISHDRGKALPSWQTYLINQWPKVLHSAPAAAELIHRYGDDIGRILAYCVAGHHGALPDFVRGLDRIPEEYSGELPENGIPLPENSGESRKALIREIQPFGTSPQTISLWIHMLFSALVDADRLDAEQAERKPDEPILRGGYGSFSELEVKFDTYMAKKCSEASDTPVNRIRNRVRQACREKAELPPGFFSLNVPTGGGKTLSSLEFALRHRKKYGLKRIVIAIPFTSIIDQTAGICRDIFGETNVLEHHCNFDPGENTPAAKAAENWDSPLIVSTNVQLLESLLGAAASRVRKIHNLAKSVILLDEAQMLPREHLFPILETLRSLVRNFGCSVVLCSATIPALEGKIGTGNAAVDGLENVTPIIDRPEELNRELRRTRTVYLGDIGKDELLNRIDASRQALVIVNTRRQCRELFQALSGEGKKKYHLSAAMCPEDRREVLARIAGDLKTDRPLVIVATSLIEAGVDLDVETVFREGGGLDSAAQAAGRCNREGKRAKVGEVFLFDPLRPLPNGELSFRFNAGKAFLEPGKEVPLTPELYRKYFQAYYAQSPGFDAAEFRPLILENAGNLKFEFRSFAEGFHLVDDAYSAPLTVLFRDSAKYVEDLRKSGPSRARFRKLQRYTVNLPKKTLEQLEKAGLIETIYGVNIQLTPGLYHPGIGVELPEYGFYMNF